MARVWERGLELSHGMLMPVWASHAWWNWVADSPFNWM